MRIVAAHSAPNVSHRRHVESRDGTATYEADCPSKLPVLAVPRPEHHTDLLRRSYVPFLAHLIAVRTDAPQMRGRRRAAPDEVISAYQAVQASAYGDSPPSRPNFAKSRLRGR